MGETPEAEVNATFTDVRGDTKATAESNLSAFTNITWAGKGDVVVTQEPSSEIGKSEPTNLAITLTLGSAR